jgi:hypothetical protein
VIFLSDQDDVWAPQKVARMVEALSANPRAGFAFCDADVADELLRPMGYRFWDSLGFTGNHRREFEADPLGSLMKINVVAGATMAFRSRYRALALPVPGEWLHDHWIALVIAAVAEAVVVPEALNVYRQHATQQLGGRRKSLWQWFREARRVDPGYFAAQLRKYELLAERLEAAGSAGGADLAVKPGVRELIGGKVRHAAARAAMRRRWWLRPPLVAREALTLRYARFGQGWKSLLADVLC